MVENASFERFIGVCQEHLEASQHREIQKNFALVRSALQHREIRLKQPREIIPLHENIIDITMKLIQIEGAQAKNLSPLWLKTLTDLNGKTVLRVGVGRSKFDCSTAIKMIQTGAAPKISIEELDKENEREFEGAMKAIVQAEEESFWTFLSRDFTRILLAKPESRCVVAKDEGGEVLGFIWGFSLNIREKKVFHMFALAHKVEMAKFGIAQLLAHEGIGKIGAKPLDAIALSLKENNGKAVEFFKKLGFQTELSEEQLKKVPSDAKIFMFKNLKSIQTGAANVITASVMKSAICAFMITSIGFLRLILYELIRRLDLLWRKIIYSF